MKILTLIARILLGLLFVVFGLNGFLHFIPMPPQADSPATRFSGALFTTGYGYVVMTLQVLGGLLILSGRFLPLGLLLLGPVIVNILLFHLFLEPKGLPMAIVISVVSLFLLFRHWSVFAPIFRPYKPSPAERPAS